MSHESCYSDTLTQSLGCAGEQKSPYQCALGLMCAPCRLGIGLALVVYMSRCIRQFAVCMASFAYIDLIDTVAATSPARPCTSTGPVSFQSCSIGVRHGPLPRP